MLSSIAAVLLSSLRSLKQCSRNIQLLRYSPNKAIYLQQQLEHHSYQSCIDFRSRYKTEHKRLRPIKELYRKRRISSLEVRVFVVFGLESNTYKKTFSVPVLPSNVSSSRTQIAGVLPIPTRRARKEACHRQKADTISEVSLLTPTPHCLISSAIQSGVFHRASPLRL